MFTENQKSPYWAPGFILKDAGGSHRLCSFRIPLDPTKATLQLGLKCGDIHWFEYPQFSLLAGVPRMEAPSNNKGPLYTQWFPWWWQWGWTNEWKWYQLLVETNPIPESVAGWYVNQQELYSTRCNNSFCETCHPKLQSRYTFSELSTFGKSEHQILQPSMHCNFL